MKPLSRNCIVIVAALTILTTDAQISLKTNDTSQNSFICGEQQVLICTIGSYSNIMTWSRETDQLAFCQSSTCVINPSTIGSYNFSFDTDNGIFQMKIITVKVADNGITYSCGAGFLPENIVADVKVKDVFSIVNDSKKIDSNTTEISVTTGCIQDSVAEGVKFGWWSQEVNNTSSEKRKINESATVTYNSSVCIADPDCGVSNYSSITNSVNITNEESGKTYRIGVDVISGDTLINSVSFDLFFILNFPVPAIDDGCAIEIIECVIGIFTAYSIIFLESMQLCLYGRYQCAYYLKKRELLLFSGLHLCSHVPVFGFLISIYLNKSLEKKELCQNHDQNQPRLPQRRVTGSKNDGVPTPATRAMGHNRHGLTRFQTSAHGLSSITEPMGVQNHGEHSNLSSIYQETPRQMLPRRQQSSELPVEISADETLMQRTDGQQQPATNKLKLSCSTFWISVLCSTPLIGLVVKVGLVIHERKSEHLHCWKIGLFVCFWIASMTCEIFIILLCTVWCISQWCVLAFVLHDLIFRWILFIIIAVLYYGYLDIRSDDVTVPFVGRIALWCMPVFGSLIKFCHIRHNRRHIATQPTEQSSEVNMFDLEKKQIQETRLNEEFTPDPRPLQRLPKVKSSSELQSLEKSNIEYLLMNTCTEPLQRLPKVKSSSELQSQEIEDVFKKRVQLPQIGSSQNSKKTMSRKNSFKKRPISFW